MPANTVGTAQKEVPVITVGAEAANVIPLSIQIKDLLGNNISRAAEVIVTVYEATMIEAVAAAFTLADGGAGSLVSTTGNARVIATSSTAGLLELNLTDVAGASGKTVQVVAQVLDSTTANTRGGTTRAAATFD